MEQTNWNHLDEALGVHNTNANPWPLCGRFVLVEDCVDTSAAFVLHHILKRSFSSHPSSSVVFVAFSHPFSHYDRILRKLGFNLAAQRDNGRFFFLDMLMLQCPDEGKSNHDGLASVFEQIERVITELHEDKKSISIMIDDMSFLEVAANGSSNDVLNLLHYCHTLTSEYGCAFIALHHKDIYLDGDRDAAILEMEYLADILVKAEPLATGIAKDVHGQSIYKELQWLLLVFQSFLLYYTTMFELMVLDKKTQHEHGISAIKTHNFHFKIKENGIECFYPGTKI